jgi:carbonic anhydrase
VIPESIFSVGIGELFVIRLAIGDETDSYRACCLNVEHCVDQISHALDIDFLRHGNDPAVVGAIYHIDDGHVEFL